MVSRLGPRVIVIRSWPPRLSPTQRRRQCKDAKGERQRQAAAQRAVEAVAWLDTRVRQPYLRTQTATVSDPAHERLWTLASRSGFIVLAGGASTRSPDLGAPNVGPGGNTGPLARGIDRGHAVARGSPGGESEPCESVWTGSGSISPF